MALDAINRERINDRGKLLFHRMVARRLKRSPELIERARDYLSARRSVPGDRYPTLHEWDDILKSDVHTVRRLIVRRGLDMDRLRLSSPFAFMTEFTIRDEAVRRKLWRIAKKGLVRNPSERPTISIAQSGR